MLDFFKVTATSLGANVRVLLAQLRGVGAEGDDENAEPIDGAEVIYPLGLVSRPVIDDDHDTEAVGFQDGDEITVLGFIVKTLAKLTVTPALEEGETRLFGAKEPSCIIRLTPDGDIIVIPKSGQKVFVGAATGTQASLMGDDVTQRLNDLRDAVNSCRADIQAIATATVTTTCGAGPGSGSFTTLGSLPTASAVAAAPAQSTIVENA